MRGEGASCLHFIWNKKAAEGYVKGSCLCLFVYVHI